MKNRAFRKFVASIGVAAMVMSTATNALSPAVTKAESAQELEGQQNDSQEQGGQEDPVGQSSDDANGAPFADAELMPVSSEDSQDSQEAAGPSESSDSNGENGAEGSSGENMNASAGSTSTDASGAESQGAAGTMSGATNGAAGTMNGTTNSTIPGTTGNAGTMSGATNGASANGTSANTSTDAANGSSTGASTGMTTGENGEASGDNAEASTKEITSVITEDIDLGTYPAGEAPAYAQLELPDEIEVKVDEEKQIVTVTWNGEETYQPDQAGTYIFSSELDKEWNKDENGNARYQLAEKVELPKASVRVEKKAESKEENKTDVKSDNKTENKTDAKLDNKKDSKTDAKADNKKDSKTDTKADNKSEGKTEEKSDNKSEVTTKPETAKDTSKETAKDTSKETSKETSKKNSTSKDETKDETKGETKDKTKDETKAEATTDTKDESAKADQKKKVTNVASLKAVYVAEDGTILCGTVGLTGDSFTISDKAKSFNGYELKTVTLGEEELPQDTAFTRNTSTTETKEEIRTEASYTYTMDGAEHEIAAGDTATITFTYAQKEEVTPEIASIEVTGEAVDTTGAAIQGDYAFPLAVGTNDLSKTAPYIQGYEYQYAEIGTDKITSIAKEVLEAGKYAYYVDGELLKENTKITYVYQEDEDYTEQLTGICGNLTVTVSAKKDAKIPEGTIVKVSPIESARMSQIMAKISETLGQDPDNVIGVLYDISLDKDGEEIQPKESVHVTMKFDGGIPWNVPEGKQIADTKVVHMHGGETDVVVEAAEDGKAEFETESFSTYGFAAKVAASQDGTVNQGTTIEISATENSAKVGEPLSVTVHATNSTPQNEETHSEVRINVSQIPDSILCNSVNGGKLKDGDQFQVIPKDNATPVTVEYHANQGEGGGYFTATIPAGITIEFDLTFEAKNGVTKNNTAITLTPEITDSNDNDKVGEPKTLTWSAENKWSQVQKTVDAGKIQISQDNKTTTKLNYEIKAESLSDETTGMVWTKNVEINDTLTLPSGWNFPEGCTVDCTNGQVKDEAGNVIWALDTTKNPGTQIKEMTINDTTLSFKADVPNTNYPKNTTSPNPLDYAAELKSINLKGTLDTAYLILPENEFKNDKVGEKKIENRVEIQPYDLYGNPSTKSDNTVTTTPQGNTTEPATEKSVDKAQAKPGEEITYNLTLKNGNTGLPIHGSDKDPGKDQSSDAAYYWAEDKLPTSLTLTKDEIDTIKNNPDLVVKVEKDENTGEYTIRFRLGDNKTLNAGESVSLVIPATIKSYQDLQGVNTITNSFSWHGSRSNEVFTSIDQPNVDLTKVVDENAKDGIHDGETTSYTLKVTNNSEESYDYEDEVTDELPQGLFITNFVNDADHTIIDFRSANSGEYHGTIGGKQVTVNRDSNGRLTLTWKPGEIPAHESVALTYEVIFDATKADQNAVQHNENNPDYVNLKNTAKLKKKGGDGVSVEIPGIIGSTNISKSITKKNDVALDKGTTEAEGQENDVFEFSVTVSNESQDAAYTLPIQVHDVLPEGMLPVGLIVDNNEVKSLSGLTTWQKYSGKLNGRDVKVQNSNGHCELFWTVNGLEKGGVDTFTYQAKIDLSQITSGSSGQFQLTNTAEENGKEASATIKVKPLKIDKKIVDSDGGEIIQSDISAGQEVTYKLSITNTSSSPITITDAKDILPGTMETASYWVENSGNVTVVSGTGNDDFVSNFTEKDSIAKIEQLWNYSGKAVISWPSITVPANTTLTQLVKLKYPEGETFGKLFTEEKTENTFQYGEEKATVVHNQATKKYFYMQKGVVKLAKKDEYNNITAINSKDLFQKDEANFAVYYIVVVNTGNTGDENIHVSSISDSMPYGLSFAGLYDIYGGIKSPLITNTNNQYNDYVGLGSDYTGKSGVNISSQAAVGAKEVSFSIANGEGVDLGPGEYLTFAVAATIDAGIQPKDTLTNIAYALVDADAKVHSISINSEKTPNDAVQNNGGCTVVAKNENTQTVESAVSIHPYAGIVPGIEKKAVEYYDKTITGSVWKSLNSDHTTCISSDSAVKWVITLYNDGLEPMTGYKLLDDLDVPFKYVNDFQGYSSIIQIYGSDGKQIGENRNLNVTNAVAAEQAEQQQKPTHYEFSFYGLEYQIPAGGKAVVTLISDNPKKTQKLNYIYNNAKLIPVQPFDGNYVLHGQLEQKDGESTYEGVSSGDYVNALGQYGSTSYKTVCEKDNPSNIGYGIRENESGKKRAISVERNAAETDTVVYTNLVQNSSRNNFTNVVVIDRMPEKGDCGVVNQNESRNSEFSVGLPSDANFVVAIEGKPLGNDDYAIRYSNKTSFSDEDFNGTSDWNGSAENAKSFRVVLRKELKPGEKLTIQYDGVISKEAQPGQYAWNSFGYRYKVGDKELTAEPPKVGVTIPSVPKIEKRLLDSSGKETTGDQNYIFEFKDNTDNTKANIRLSVKAGSYTEMTPVTTVNAITSGSFIEGHKYTVTEVLPENSDSHFVSIGQKDGTQSTDNSTGYTFTYHKADNIDIVGTNQLYETESKVVNDSVSLTKVDSTSEETKLSGAEFTLYKTAECKETDKLCTYTTDSKGTLTISTKDESLEAVLPANAGESTTLTLKETKAPTGYKINNPAPSYPVTITKSISGPTLDAETKKYVTTTTYGMTIDGQKAKTVTNDIETVNIKGSKTWSDDNNRDNKRPSSITVNLFADGTKVASQKITEANGWKYEFKDLPKYEDGKEIKYTITEDVVDGYTSSINGFNITNTYTPEKVQVSGSKNWNDDGNAAGTRPGSITIRLYANGSEIDHKTVTEKDGWSWNWTGLNRYDTDHKEISYTISEDAVDGYTSSISGYNVTNTVNKPQVGSVILTKVDATTGTALAGAVFDLYRANNTKVGTYTTNAGGVLRVDGLTFGDYYFVETKAPEGYALESQRAAFTINAATTVSAPASVRVTNKPVDEKIGVSAAKVWDDENNTDGVRPSSVTFRLFADGVEIGSAQASEANGWTVSFGNLPKTRNGVAISYAVKEDEVGNYYEASYETGLGSDGSYVFTVKNYRETDKHYEERTGSVRGANRNKPSNGGVAGAGRGRGTGDESDMTVYGTVSGASLLALIVWMIARRKRAGKGTK